MNFKNIKSNSKIYFYYIINFNSYSFLYIKKIELGDDLPVQGIYIYLPLIMALTGLEFKIS